MEATPVVSDRQIVQLIRQCESEADAQLLLEAYGAHRESLGSVLASQAVLDASIKRYEAVVQTFGPVRVPDSFHDLLEKCRVGS